MSGFYIRGLSPERMAQLREQAVANDRDVRDEAKRLLIEALDARLRAEKRSERIGLVTAAAS